jgi:YVTN family beta-propeller protein
LFAYVTNTGDDTVSVISTATNIVVDTISVGAACPGPGPGFGQGFAFPDGFPTIAPTRAAGVAAPVAATPIKVVPRFTG